MAETALDAVGRSNALRKVCGYAYPGGPCDGSVRAVTAHVGVCDGCGAVWYVRRKSRHQDACAAVLRIGGADGVWPSAIHELVRELADRQRLIDRAYAAQRRQEGW